MSELVTKFVQEQQEQMIETRTAVERIIVEAVRAVS